MASSSSSSSPVIINCAHDVFLSFRGHDVRRKFRSHFLKELDRKVITFKDDEMERGRSIGPELIKAIQGSRISVVAFSENFANSSWCLDELAEIMRCREERGQIVIPIFYDVDPSHVRYQTHAFGEIFEKTCKGRKEEDKHMWRQALTHAANIAGEDSRNWYFTRSKNTSSLKKMFFFYFCRKTIFRGFFGKTRFRVSTGKRVFRFRRKRVFCAFCAFGEK